MKRVWRENGLSIVLGILFLVFLAAQSVTGLYRYNDEQRDHGEPEVTYLEYLKSGEFLEATMENWESEFLQMGMYVLLTTFLFQKGSAESNKLDKPMDPPRPPRPDSPWPVRRGGIWKLLYEYSLSSAFFILFVLSIWLHAIGGTREYNEHQIAHGGEAVSVSEFIRTAQFWFESFQNWQSEFLAILAMVVLSIFLRQEGSPESKPVDAPHHQTGKE
jgi:hypothetical protein